MATISEASRRKMHIQQPRSPGNKPDAPIGGYQDRPWIPRFWDGMLVSKWLKIIADNQFRIAPRRIGMATILTMTGLFNSSAAALQALLYGRKIRGAKIEEEPIFILGHWRSGTTLLHELLVLDPRHTYPDTYACYAPNHYVLTRRVIPRMLAFLLPARRPMDNMPAGWDRPQEDEFALCNMGLPSPYLTMIFPNRPPQCQEYLDLEGVPAQDLARWKDALLWFLKCVTLADPKRIVLKSPPHTARVRVLCELFPRAKFVHIVRDPYVLFASTLNLWKRLYRDEALQIPRFEGLEEYVLNTLERMYKAFERDRSQVAPSHLAEVRYEDLVQDPIGQMRRIYDDLQLGGWEGVAPRLEEYVASQADYKPNRYQISPEMRAKVNERWAGYIQKYGYAAE